MDEFGGAQVGDARLGRRLIKLVDRLGDAPSASIPGACNGRTETQAAYRFFDQARADRTRVGLGVRSGAAHGAHRGLYGSAPGGAVPAEDTTARHAEEPALGWLKGMSGRPSMRRNCRASTWSMSLTARPTCLRS